MKSLVVLIGVVLTAGMLLGNETAEKKNDLYEDKGNSIKRELTAEDRKQVLEDSEAVSKKDIEKIKEQLQK